MKHPVCQRNLEKKKKAGGIILPDLRLYYKATLIHTAYSTATPPNLQMPTPPRLNFQPSFPDGASIRASNGPLTPCDEKQHNVRV